MPINILTAYGINIFDYPSDYIRRTAYPTTYYRYQL